MSGKIAWLCVAGVIAGGAIVSLFSQTTPSISPPVFSPSFVPAGLATQVMVSCQVVTRIGDPPVLANGVNLLRLNSSNQVISTLGVMQDNGTGGDAAANDGIFTLRFTALEMTTGAIRVQCSAALQGVLLRIRSPIASIPVTAVTAMCQGEAATIVGTEGDDNITGTPGRDVIAGLGGNDTINGLGGDDVICGGPGDDILIGGAGQNTLDGGEGDDTCLEGNSTFNCEKFSLALSGAALDNLTTDTDNDGIFDQRELEIGTNPRSADTDGDGFNDGFEDTHRQFGFDPLRPNRDTDGDGLTDDSELALRTSPTNPDTDGDGWSDLDEHLNRRFGFDPLVFTFDTDFDGLADSLEVRIGTSLTNPDTDGDGQSDFEEFQSGGDPLTADVRLIELGGTSASAAMLQAVSDVRNGGTFSVVLAGELPFPELTRTLIEQGRVRPSAALMTQAAGSPPNLYANHNAIVQQLQAIARRSPLIAELRTLGSTEVGRRPMLAMKVQGTGRQADQFNLLYMALHHARELPTAAAAVGFLQKLTTDYGTDRAITDLVDRHRIIVIPVVNPDGYEMVIRGQLNWRKNARKVPELRPDGTEQTLLGVDNNRNYSFEHIRTLTRAQRQALSVKAKRANGLDLAGEFEPDRETYAGLTPASEFETRAVVASANDLFPNGNMVTGRKCSLSWHTYGGSVSNPMGHAPTPPADARHFLNVGTDIAAAAGYRYLVNGFRSEPTGYDTYGDSDDWLYTDHGVLAFTVEAFADFERGAEDPLFYTLDRARLNQLVDRNVRGALAMAQSNDCNVT